jgi:lysozyme family protein
VTRREAADIYRQRYWRPMHCGELPAGVDLMVFDFGVNAGPGTSVKMLQRAVGVVDDGSVGPRTLAAVKAAAGLIDALVEARLAHYRSLSNFATYGNGWTSRTRQVADLARGMRAGA